MTSDSDKHLAGDYSGSRADSYHCRRFDGSARMRKLNEIEMAFARLVAQKVGPDGVVIDVPCGAGRFTEVFSGCKYVYSVDLSQDMLAVASANAPAGLRGEFIKASALEIPLQDKTVDLAFCMRLFHHLGNPETRGQLFRELTRLSRQWVAVSFYRTGSYRYFRKRLMRRKLSGQPVPTSVFVAEAERHGLRLVSLEPHGVGAFLKGSAQTLALFQVERHGENG